MQDPRGFCYGVDAVILAGYTHRWTKDTAVRPKRLCDLGTGTGVVPLILSHKTGIPEIVGVELLKENCDLALETADINGLGDRMHFVNGDVQNIVPGSDILSSLGGGGSFDIVTSNPPYFPIGSGEVNRGQSKGLARHEVQGGLRDFVTAAATLLKDKGSFFMVHRPERLVDIVRCSTDLGLEPKRMKLFSGHRDERANLLIVQFVKGGGRQLTVEGQGFVRKEDGGFSSEILSLYEKDK